MVPTGCFLLAFAVAYVHCLPTMYKYNENRILEKDLVPVSSTVIPLPIYKVSSVVDGVPSVTKGDKLKKPEGPVTLLTASGNKKATSQDKKMAKHVTKKNLGDIRD
ncbi:uncharacterized protein LOC132706359 [Cylas formicarius]|uniref:uncharacterized protein LOC132706359 n=1 Tax=Cylas formicarius TaxID=197179 RepID=UPI0029584ECC|nr:uncharacterized protein LOC132706359 [Cylas formicarius]